MCTRSWKGLPGGWPGLESGNGPEVADVPQLIPMIVLGRTIAVLPRSLAGPVPAELVCVPVTDAPPNRLVIAWS